MVKKYHLVRAKKNNIKGDFMHKKKLVFIVLSIIVALMMVFVLNKEDKREETTVDSSSVIKKDVVKEEKTNLQDLIKNGKAKVTSISVELNKDKLEKVGKISRKSTLRDMSEKDVKDYQKLQNKLAEIKSKRLKKERDDSQSQDVVPVEGSAQDGVVVESFEEILDISDLSESELKELKKIGVDLNNVGTVLEEDLYFDGEFYIVELGSLSGRFVYCSEGVFFDETMSRLYIRDRDQNVVCGNAFEEQEFQLK